MCPADVTLLTFCCGTQMCQPDIPVLGAMKPDSCILIYRQGMEATLERHSPVVAAALPHALSTARADLAAAAAALRQNAMPGSGGDARGPLLAMPGARRRRAAALDDVVTITGFVAHIAAGDLAFVFASSLGVSLLRPSASHVAVSHCSPCVALSAGLACCRQQCVAAQ